MQIMALAVLIVILLPVVSLTDDLQTCTAPAEVEHLMRRDLQCHPDSPLHAASVVLATLLSFQKPSGLEILPHFVPSIEIVTPRERGLSVVGNRPPPDA